jgi:hypothetical protein
MALTLPTAPPSPIRALLENVEAALTKAMPDKQSLVQATEKTSSQLQTRIHTTLQRSREVRTNSFLRVPY